MTRPRDGSSLAAVQKINLAEVPGREVTSAKGRYRKRRQEVSRALGARDAGDRAVHPFEVELVTLPPGARFCPYHSHSAETELYIVVSGRGQVRHPAGVDDLRAGDCVVFPPGEAHQLLCPEDAAGPLVYWVIANNVQPGTDVCYYPDSGKWAGLPGVGAFRLTEFPYHEGEE